MSQTIQRIYAGSSIAGLVELPSPVSITKTEELIWDANAGRATSGSDVAKMIGTIKGRKTTYEIQWGVLTQSQYNTIKTNMHDAFFYFACATSKPTSGVSKFYRSEIKATMMGHYTNGSSQVYKDVSVTVIEQ